MISPFHIVFFEVLYFCLQYLLQCIKTLIPNLRQMFDPYFQSNQGIGIELVQALLSPFFFEHQLRLTQPFEVLVDRRGAEVEVLVVLSLTVKCL
jgi:hypothetical protein